MAIDERTSRGYLLPSPDNKLKDDVQRVRSAFSAIDEDVTEILFGLGLKAAIEHVHDVGDVTGLQDLLDDKVSISTFSLDLDNLADVNAPSPTGNQVLMRVGSFWVPVNLQVNHVTGLETALTEIGSAIAPKWDVSSVSAAASKSNPVDTDVFALVDAGLKKLTWANFKSALNALYQAKLNFTPVQQGGGVGQGTNVIKIGHSGSGPRITVDATDFGPIAFGKKTQSSAGPGGGENGDFHLQF